MKVTSLHSTPEIPDAIGITVVELDHDEAKQYKRSEQYKHDLKIVAGEAMRAANTKGIIIEEFQGSDFLDILNREDAELCV